MKKILTAGFQTILILLISSTVLYPLQTKQLVLSNYSAPQNVYYTNGGLRLNTVYQNVMQDVTLEELAGTWESLGRINDGYREGAIVDIKTSTRYSYAISYPDESWDPQPRLLITFPSPVPLESMHFYNSPMNNHHAVGNIWVKAYDETGYLIVSNDYNVNVSSQYADLSLDLETNMVSSLELSIYEQAGVGAPARIYEVEVYGGLKQPASYGYTRVPFIKSPDDQILAVSVEVSNVYELGEGYNVKFYLDMDNDLDKTELTNVSSSGEDYIIFDTHDFNFYAPSSNCYLEMVFLGEENKSIPIVKNVILKLDNAAADNDPELEKVPLFWVHPSFPNEMYMEKISLVKNSLYGVSYTIEYSAGTIKHPNAYLQLTNFYKISSALLKNYLDNPAEKHLLDLSTYSAPDPLANLHTALPAIRLKVTSGHQESLRTPVQPVYWRINQLQDTLIGSLSNGVALKIPAGALPRDVAYLGILKKNTALYQQKGDNPALANDTPAAVYDMQIYGYPAISFREPVEITLSYSDTNNDGVEDQTGLAETSLALFYYDGLDWYPAGGTRDQVSNRLHAKISSSGIYGILAADSSAIDLTTAEWSQTVISPNADGQFDTTFLGFDAEEEKELKVQIMTIKGTLIKTLYDGKTASLDGLAWDGTDANNQTVPQGIYLARVAAGSKNYYTVITVIR